MSNRTLITAIAVAGLALSGCDKENGNEIADPERREIIEEPRAVEPTLGQQQPATTPTTGTTDTTPTEDLQTLPAVTIIGIDVGCTAMDVYFPTDSAELDAADKAALDGLAACLQGTPGKEQVEITATADPRGPEPYNEELSRKRAEAVAAYLRQQGVKEGSFEIRARGEKGVIEGVPALWPWQRSAVVEPKEPVTP